MNKTDLLRVRKVLETAWTNDGVANKADGTRTHSRDPDAVCWCLYGACARLDLHDLARALAKYLPDGAGYGEVNRTQAEGLAFIDRVIGELEK